jgi:hypothetical protein
MFHVKPYKDYTAEDWANLNGWGWYCLLSEQPQFSIHCAWEKLDGNDWRWLLKEQPEFSIHCDWEKLDGNDWRWLLKEQPQLKQLRECFT